MNMRRSKALVAIFACTIVGLVACGGGDKSDTGTSPSADFPEQPTAGSNPPSTPVAPPTSTKGAGICEGKETYASTDKAFEFCVLESSLELKDDRCMLIPEEGGSWTHTIGIQKGSGYFLDQIFTSADNNCGATGEGGGAGPNNDRKFAEGEKITLDVRAGPGCGRKQQDIYAVVNGVRTWVRAVVLNYPKPCRTCESAKLELSKQENNSENGFSVTISADWSKVKGDSATIEGPGASGTLTNPGSFPAISLPKDGQTRTYTVTLTFADGTKCVKTISVTPPVPGCNLREVSLAWSEGGQEASAASVSASAVGNSGHFTLTWSGAPSSSSIDPDIAQDPPAASSTGASSPATLNHTYALQSVAKSYTAKGTVVFKDGTKCDASTTVQVRAYTCRDFGPIPVSVSLGNPDVTLTATQLTVNSIPVTQDAGVTGSFTPALPSGPHNRPNAGQPAGNVHFDYNWEKAYNPADGLTCKVTGKASKDVPIPPKDDTCENYQAPAITGDIAVQLTSTDVNFSSGSVAPPGGTFANEALPASKPRPEYGEPSGSFSTTYTLPYGPEQLNCKTQKTFTKPVPPKEPTCEQQNPPSYTASGTHAYYTPGSTTYRQYWKMNQGNDNARENACVNRGGVWLNDYNIPDDGQGGTRPDVCRFDFPSPPAGAPGADMTLYDPPGTVTIVTDPDGVKVTGTATFNNAGTWRVEIYATGQGGPWVKDFKEVTLQCGQSSTKNVSYTCQDCHENSTFFIRVFRNGVQQPGSPIQLN